MGAETGKADNLTLGKYISTHSARGGGDQIRRFRPSLALFQFQPTPPVGAETQNLGGTEAVFGISTHSARGGGDPGLPGTAWKGPNFNPLRPWGRRPQPCQAVQGLCYFNPLRPWGRRLCRAVVHILAHVDFNPLRPWGRRHTKTAGMSANDYMISTHSARGGGDEA